MKNQYFCFPHWGKCTFIDQWCYIFLSWKAYFDLPNDTETMKTVNNGVDMGKPFATHKYYNSTRKNNV